MSDTFQETWNNKMENTILVIPFSRVTQTNIQAKVEFKDKISVIMEDIYSVCVNVHVYIYIYKCKVYTYIHKNILFVEVKSVSLTRLSVKFHLSFSSQHLHA